MDKTVFIQRFNWQDLCDDAAYAEWRDAKIAMAKRAMDQPPVTIEDLRRPTSHERKALAQRCQDVNFAHYASAATKRDPDEIAADLRQFCFELGLDIAERHRSAGGHGIVALKVSQDPNQRNYIPYTTRSMNWHTDGYYNAPGDYVAGFVLHCVRPAAVGGINQFVDPEIAYIRLRDHQPLLVKAMMHPKAMTIPENRETDGQVRPESTGPVFFPDPTTGRLQMRYTARTRSVVWREDAATQEAQTFLREHLGSNDPLACRLSFRAGEGILNNNVLHNRTGFNDDGIADAGRLVYRIRFHNRIKGS